MWFCTFAQLVIIIIFFSAWDKSQVKWDNSQNSMKMKTPVNYFLNNPFYFLTMWNAPCSPQYCNCHVIEKANRERKGNWPHYPCLFNLHIQKTKEDFLSLYTKHCIALVRFIYSCWSSFSTSVFILFIAANLADPC